MKPDDFISDEQKFQEWLQAQNLEEKRVYFICLGGIGDHFVAKKVILKFIPKLQDYKIMIGTVYPDVFWDLEKNIKIVPIDFVKDKIGDVESFNVYGWMARHCWKKQIGEAYENMFKELLYRQSVFI